MDPGADGVAVPAPAGPSTAAPATTMCRRIFGQMTLVSRSQRAQIHLAVPGSFHNAELHRSQRAQPSVHAHPSMREVTTGQPRPRHSAHRGSGPSTRWGQTIAHFPQSLQLRWKTSYGVGASGATDLRIAPFGQAKTQIPQPSQPGPTSKLTVAPTGSRKSRP